MLAANESNSEHDPEDYKVAVFMYITDDTMPKYDFRAKSIDTAMDLIIGIANRPAYKNSSISVSITIGIINYSFDATGAARTEEKLRAALDLTNWSFL